METYYANRIQNLTMCSEDVCVLGWYGGLCVQGPSYAYFVWEVSGFVWYGVWVIFKLKSYLK